MKFNSRESFLVVKKRVKIQIISIVTVGLVAHLAQVVEAGVVQLALNIMMNLDLLFLIKCLLCLVQTHPLPILHNR